MVYVVNETTEKILFKIDAWETDSVNTAVKWAKDNGYKLLRDGITSMGDMIIWVIR